MIPFIESAKDEILAKIDALKTTIDRLISSSQGSNPNIALGNLSNKIDALKQNVDTKSSQTAVNKVGQDLNNIASTITSKIDIVETKVNQTNTTLATKANQNTVDAVANTANQINTALASKASQASVNTLQSIANNIYNKIATGSVKMVQRGLITTRIEGTQLPSDGYDSVKYYKDITLPYSVNTNKALAFLGVGWVVVNNSDSEVPTCQLVNNNILRVIWPRSSYLYSTLSWQVIEYY